MNDERERWTARWLRDLGSAERPPSEWVIARCLELPPNVLIVDLASGQGRHAMPLAARGRRVLAVDFIESAVREAARTCRVSGLVAEASMLPLREASLDALLIVNFLDRALYAQLWRLLRPGGRSIAETYLRAHAELVEQGLARAPRDPAYMLEPGELANLVRPLEVEASHEGLVNDGAGLRYAAGIVAVRKTRG